jgi:hypothetical protein
MALMRMVLPLGPQHQETVESLIALVRFLLNQEDYAAAGRVLQRALAIREEILGPGHAHTQTIHDSLARLNALLAQEE